MKLNILPPFSISRIRRPQQKFEIKLSSKLAFKIVPNRTNNILKTTRDTTGGGGALDCEHLFYFPRFLALSIISINLRGRSASFVFLLCLLSLLFSFFCRFNFCHCNRFVLVIRSSTIYRTAQVFHPSYHTFGNVFKPLQAICNICLIPWCGGMKI